MPSLVPLPPAPEPMPPAPDGIVSGWLAPWRTPARTARLARALWIVWALVVWNVVFDRVLVLAGRRFVYEAAVATSTGQGYLSAGSWMREATYRGVFLASVCAALILAVGMGLIRVALRRAAGAQALPELPESRR